jgi:enterobactin synthetase component D
LRVARVAEVRGAAPTSLAMSIALPPETAAFAPRRLDTFLRGRAAALLALRELAVAPGALAIGPRGAPEWPPGVVGSITHDETLAAAAVAFARELRGVGIDAQTITHEPPDTIALVATEDELARIPSDARFTVAFSAKETLYKCLAPTVGSFFGFEDARVVSASGDRVRLRLERALHTSLAAGDSFDVAWRLDGERVLTALEWPMIR